MAATSGTTSRGMPPVLSFTPSEDCAARSSLVRPMRGRNARLNNRPTNSHDSGTSSAMGKTVLNAEAHAASVRSSVCCETWIIRVSAMSVKVRHSTPSST
jgi:hypothetical protein